MSRLEVDWRRLCEVWVSVGRARWNARLLLVDLRLRTVLTYDSKSWRPLQVFPKICELQAFSFCGARFRKHTVKEATYSNNCGGHDRNRRSGD